MDYALKKDDRLQAETSQKLKGLRTYNFEATVF